MMGIALISGVILGMLFFGGLWFTVKKTLGNKNAPMWILVSSLVRTVAVLTGFYFVGQGNWQHLLTAVAGFIIARFVILWITRKHDHTPLISSRTNQS